MTLDPRTLPTGPGISFGDNAAAFADNFALYLQQPLSLDQFAAWSDSTAGAAVTLPQAPAEVSQAVGGLFSDAANQATTWLAWGGVALTAVLLLQRAAVR